MESKVAGDYAVYIPIYDPMGSRAVKMVGAKADVERLIILQKKGNDAEWADAFDATAAKQGKDFEYRIRMREEASGKL